MSLNLGSHLISAGSGLSRSSVMETKTAPLKGAVHRHGQVLIRLS